MEDYWATRGLDIPVPSSSQLCERFAALQVSVRQRSVQLARRLASGEAIIMIVDSTGLSFGRASEWYEQNYGRKATQMPRRKMHLSIDADMTFTRSVSRRRTCRIAKGWAPCCALICRWPVQLRTVRYSIERTEALSRVGMTPVIPPPAHAVVHGSEDTRRHDEIVKYIQDKGIYGFHKKYGYGLRARAEAQISRIKRCIGAIPLTQKIASQECEGVIIANLINLWNAFGKPVCVKNA
jgi:hypothetical protein